MTYSRLLLADDHALVRAGIRNALNGMPDLEIVGEVGDGIALEKALATLMPDCVLIDVAMPNFKPISTIHRVRKMYPSLRILVVSAYDDDVYVQGLLGAGVNGYHLKDQPLSDLRLAVQRVLAGERWISSPLLDKLLKQGEEEETAVSPLPSISSRQRDILQLLSKGADNRTIATTLHLSIKTIENHLTRLYRLLGVHNRLEAAVYVRKHPTLIADEEDAIGQKRSPITLPQGEQVTILLVDDNNRYRKQLSRMIGRICPAAVLYEAENISEARRLTKEIAPEIAFVDVVLGDEDGIRCTRRIKTASPETRVILISAYPDREFHRRGLEAGAMAFVDKKDLDAATLNQIIQDATL